MSTLAAFAQAGGKPVIEGNPTPGIEQPAPPNLGDRVTLTGCLRTAPRSGANSAPPDANTPSDARFVLADAERVDRVPPGTGGSPLATAASSRTYRLEGIESQFSPFVNTTVEISGEIKAASGAGAAGSGPTLIVGFVQKLASTCANASAKEERGEIRGRLASARGPLAAVEVRVKNAVTGEVLVVTTSRDGEYSARVTLELAPNEEIQEYICNENHKTEHFVAH